MDDADNRSVATERTAASLARRSVAIELAKEAGTACRTRAHEHQVSYRRWKLVGTALNVAAAVLASVAGATLLASAKPGSIWAVVAGAFGLLSAVLTATAGHLGASGEARANQAAAANYSALSGSYRDLAAMPPDSERDLEAALKALNDRRWQLSRDSPITEEYARRKVRERLQVENENPDPPQLTVPPPVT